MDAQAKQVLRFIDESSSKVTFGGLKRHFCKTGRDNPEKLKQVVAGLVQSGLLRYTSHFGSSFIEVSYDQPRRVSDHVIIKPPLCDVKALPGQCVVSLDKGAAFGGGEHPTTRLAIQLIDALLHQPRWLERRYACRAIDVGTGSGVLAIVAAKMAVGSVCGIDSDPCAVFEARQNVRLNQVENRVSILNEKMDDITGTYDLVFANLRMPTLFDLWSLLGKNVADESILVFSGLRSTETEPICGFYEKVGFSVCQKRAEKGWSALCLARGSLLDDCAGPMAMYGKS